MVAASGIGMGRWAIGWLAAAACVVYGAASGVAQTPSGPSEVAYAPGRVIVSFKAGVTSTERAAIAGQLGLRSRRPLGLINAEVWELDASSVDAAVAALTQDPRISYAEPDYLVTALEIPNDPMFDQLWGLHNTGQTGGTPGADIDAVRAWDVSSDAHEIVIGVIDTGVDYNHPDLAANIWTNPGEVAGDGLDNDGNGYVDDVHGYDFYNLDGDPWDDNRHGTHCAGTIAAVGNNGTGVVGVSWTAKIMALKFLGSDGVGSVSRAILALEYATLMRAKIMSNSWGGGAYSVALESAIRAAHEAGALFVAASGNSALDNDAMPFYPASYDVPNVISVAATDYSDNLAYFSNYGRTSVDLAAPGENILSTTPGGSYDYLSGTSMAAPHVSGAAALVWGRFPAMQVDDVKTLILASADPLPSLADKCLTGGRLNAFRSISEPDTVAPAAVVDLVAENPGSNTMDLRWTATGDDGFSGRATSYDLRYSVSPIDDGNFYDAAEARAPRPGPTGAIEQAAVTGLDFSTTYYFAIRVGDEYGSLSEVSNLASGTTLGVPDVAVQPLSLEENLLTGARASQALTIWNVGEGTLDLTAPPPTLTLGADARLEPRGPIGAAQARVAVDATDPEAAGSSGTDAWGYRWIDSDQPGGPTFQWVDITEIGTPIAMWGDDENSGPYPIGFDFEFYGNTFNQFRVCTNGFLSFTSTSIAYYNRPLPSTDAPENLVALLWKDLFVPQENVFYHYDGARLIVEWHEVGPLGGEAICTFEAILYPSGEIVYQYLSTESPTYYGTVGIQNAAKDDGMLVAHNTPYLHGGLAVLITRTPIWVSVSPSLGRVYAGDSLGLSVGFDATALAGGDYSADLMIRSNDPDQPTLAVPIALHVTGGPDISVSPGELDFGGVFVGNAMSLGIKVSNPGDATLEVADVVLSNPDFDADPKVFALEPRTSRTVAVSFAPSSDGGLAGALTIISNDADEPAVEVPLEGIGLLPPDISVSPDSLHEELVTGDTSTRIIAIANQGFNDLTFDVSIAMGPAPAMVAQAVSRRHQANLLPRAMLAYPAEAASAEAASAGAASLGEGCRDGERVEDDAGAAVAALCLDSESSAGGELQALGVWGLRSPLGQARAQHGMVAVPDGRIFAFGGYAGGLVSSAEIYDPATDFWVAGAPLPAPDRGMACAVDTGGDFYYFGATQGGSYRYDLGSGTWASITPPPYKYLWGAAAATGADGRIYVFGGEGTHSENPLNLVQIYDPGSGTWSLGSPMPTARYHLGVVSAPGGFIYAVGGRASSDGAPLGIVEVYDTETDTWSGAPAMPTARGQFGLAATEDGRIYAIGGKYSYFNNDGRFFDVVEVYDPLAGAWQAGPGLSGPRGELQAVVSGGTIHAVGGADSTFVASNEALATLNWLTVRPSSGTVAPGSGMGLSAAVDATALAGGDYCADILIASNDPDDIETVIPVHLHVAGAPDIAVSARSLDFGQVYLGTTGSLGLRVRNTGSEALEIGGIIPSDTDYSVSPSAFTLDPLASQDVSVGFAPSRVGRVSGTLTIASNDPREPSLDLSLDGAGLVPPEMSVSPDSLAASLPPGGSVVRTLTIANGGGSDLVFEVEVSQEATVAAASAPTLFSDDFEDGNYDGWFDTGGAGAKEVTDETAAVGIYSYHEYDSPGGHFTGIYQMLDPIQPRYIDFYIRCGYAATSAAYFVLLDSAQRDVIWFFARRTGFLYVNADVGGDESFAYAPQTWYHIEFKNVDFTAKTFDYYVDGALITAGIPFRNPESVADVSRLDLYNLDGGSEAWWDEIRLRSSEPARWLSVSPASGTVAAGTAFDVNVILDPGDLALGAYAADLLVRSNDPDLPEAVVPVRLFVSDRVEIVVEPDTLAAVSPQGKVRILNLRIGNAGIADLSYSVVPMDSALSGGSPLDWVRVAPSEGAVVGGEYADLKVRLDARGLPVGLRTASLRVTSNDQARPQIWVPIHLEVVNAVPRRFEDAASAEGPDGRVGVAAWVPTEFALGQNWPNPFSRSTSILFDLPKEAEVTLDVFNVTGERITALVDEVLPAGRYSATWGGEDERGGRASSGVYFYRMRAGDWTRTRRTLLVR